MFTKKELRTKNSMLDRVQRKEDCSYLEKLKSFNSDSIELQPLTATKLIIPTFISKEPKRLITKAELNKRRILRWNLKINLKKFGN